MPKGVLAFEFTESFEKMRNFVDLSLDEFKHDLQKVVFPIFVCLFLNMLQRKEIQKEALSFFA